MVRGESRLACRTRMQMATDPAEILIAEGNRAEDAGDLARACELYRRAVSLTPPLAKAPLNPPVGLGASGDPARGPPPYQTDPTRDPGSPAGNSKPRERPKTQGGDG